MIFPLHQAASHSLIFDGVSGESWLVEASVSFFIVSFSW